MSAPGTAIAAGRPAEQPVIGALMVSGSMLFIAAMDGFAKYLTQRYPIIEIAWARHFFHFVMLAPIVLWRYGVAATIRPPQRGLQIRRSLFLLVSTIFFFAGLSNTPIAETLALAMVAPLVVTILAPFLLGEHVGFRRLSAVTIGFLGALFIIKPGTDVFQWTALFGLGSGFVYAFYIIATRRLAGTSPPLITLTFTALVGAASTSAALPAVWVTPTLFDLAVMVGMAAMAMSGHLLVILAYERAEASKISAFAYSELIWATAIGYAAFGDFPDVWAWLGMAIICGSGVYISMRERRVAAARSPG